MVLLLILPVLWTEDNQKKPDAVPTILKRKLHEAAGTGDIVSKRF